jgi:hypothetical protein
LNEKLKMIHQLTYVGADSNQDTLFYFLISFKLEHFFQLLFGFKKTISAEVGNHCGSPEPQGSGEVTEGGSETG